MKRRRGRGEGMGRGRVMRGLPRFTRTWRQISSAYISETERARLVYKPLIFIGKRRANEK